MKYEAGPSDNSFLHRVRELERVMSNDLAFPRRFSCMYVRVVIQDTKKHRCGFYPC